MHLMFVFLIWGLQASVPSAKLSPTHHVLMRQGRRLQVLIYTLCSIPSIIGCELTVGLSLFRWRTERWCGHSPVRRRRVSGGRSSCRRICHWRISTVVGTHAKCALSAAASRIYGVYDGHGGQGISQALADEMHLVVANEACVATRHARGSIDLNLSSVLASAFKSVDDHIVHASVAGGNNGSGSMKDPGSTAVLALLLGRRLAVANVGNSRALICSSSNSSGIANDKDGRAGISEHDGDVSLPCLKWRGLRQPVYLIRLVLSSLTCLSHRKDIVVCRCPSCGLCPSAGPMRCLSLMSGRG